MKFAKKHLNLICVLFFLIAFLGLIGYYLAGKIFALDNSLIVNTATLSYVDQTQNKNIQSNHVSTEIIETPTPSPSLKNSSSPTTSPFFSSSPLISPSPMPSFNPTVRPTISYRPSISPSPRKTTYFLKFKNNFYNKMAKTKLLIKKLKYLFRK